MSFHKPLLDQSLFIGRLVLTQVAYLRAPRLRSPARSQCLVFAKFGRVSPPESHLASRETNWRGLLFVLLSVLAFRWFRSKRNVSKRYVWLMAEMRLAKSKTLSKPLIYSSLKYLIQMILTRDLSSMGFNTIRTSHEKRAHKLWL